MGREREGERREGTHVQGDALGLGLARNEPLPEGAVLLDDLQGVVLYT
jgi:hypothetical protein